MTVTEAGDARSGGWRDLALVFWEPGPVLARAAAQPVFWPPYLAAMVVTAAAALVAGFGTRELVAAAVLKQAQASGQALPGGPAGVQAMVTVGLAVGAAMAAVTPLLTGLVTALLLLLAGALRGGGGRFAQYYAVAGYALLPNLLGAVLRVPLQLGATAPEQLRRISFGPAVFFPQAGGALLGALSALDMFSLWGILLLVWGFAAVHRLRFRQALYAGALVLLARVAWSAVAGALAGAFGRGM